MTPTSARGENEALQDLSRKITGLRVEVREIATRFRLRCESELRALEERAQVAAKRTRISKNWHDYAEKAHKLIENTKVRPKKGRVKDLVRLRDIIVELRDSAPKSRRRSP